MIFRQYYDFLVWTIENTAFSNIFMYSFQCLYSWRYERWVSNYSQQCRTFCIAWQPSEEGHAKNMAWKSIRKMRRLMSSSTYHTWWTACIVVLSSSGKSVFLYDFATASQCVQRFFIVKRLGGWIKDGGNKSRNWSRFSCQSFKSKASFSPLHKDGWDPVGALPSVQEKALRDVAKRSTGRDH